MRARAGLIPGAAGTQRPDRSAAGISTSIERLQLRLHERRFWVVQGLVLLATALHWSSEALEGTTDHAMGDLFIVIMFVVYVVPVIYASLYFGREGAIPTALWAALLAIPSIVIWHQGIDRAVEGLQHIIIIALAAVIATRVDREVAARQVAERETAGRRVSEARYRGLFDAAGEAILVISSDGVIKDANAAAMVLFDRPISAVQGYPLSDLAGEHNARQLLQRATGHSDEVDDLCIVSDTQAERWLAPVCSEVDTGSQQPLLQVLLRDVTAQHQRQRGLESYARQTLVAQEEERRRIARDLHDSVLQSVILLCRQLDVIEETPPPADALPEAVGNVRASAAAIADELRRFSRDLRPSILDDLGLAPAVRWLVHDLEQRRGVRGKFVTLGAIRRLTPQQELGLFRVAQEGLRNVERHAQAASVDVTLRFTAEGIALEIEDDGRGMPAGDPIANAAQAGKLGLLGMQERVRLLGGTLTITSKATHGSRLDVSAPLVPSGASLAN